MSVVIGFSRDKSHHALLVIGQVIVLRKKMASHGAGGLINTEKTLDTDLENFHPVPEQQFGSDTLHEQDREPDGTFSLSGETESEKDNNRSPGMSFQILSNFSIYSSFYHL